MLQRCQNQFGTPGKSSPAIFAFDMPKASLGSFTKAMDPGTTMPSWRSGNTHGFCVTGGHSPIASEPTPSRRLWAAAPGATPALRIEHTTGGLSGHSKPELSTLLESGTFYFALTGTVDVLTDQLNYDNVNRQWYDSEIHGPSSLSRRGPRLLPAVVVLLVNPAYPFSIS